MHMLYPMYMPCTVLPMASIQVWVASCCSLSFIVILMRLEGPQVSLCIVVDSVPCPTSGLALKLFLSHSLQGISIIHFHPASEDEQEGYSALFTYLSKRQRCGVISASSQAVKDLYIVPYGTSNEVPANLLPQIQAST